MNQRDYINELIGKIDKSVVDNLDFFKGMEKDLMSDVLIKLKDVELTNGNLKLTKNNLKIISEVEHMIKQRMNISESFRKLIDSLGVDMDSIIKLQTTYISEMVKDYKPTRKIQAIAQNSINNVVNDFNDGVLPVEISNHVKNLLYENFAKGISFADMLKRTQSFFESSNEETSNFSNYSKQILNDSLNQFSRRYTFDLSSDLGFSWFVYKGSLLRTSRPFCKALVEVRYIHKSQFAEILKGNIAGNKVDLQGVREDTTPSNFHIYAGGYNCGHQLVPVADVVVPDDIKNQLK